ncbi:hypothetical protein [Staphylococcus kloosii]|jgi:hypothetical protein|uniref:hypothetical protein n=1 Tax=Staphylococcus kloosii TaxID=29384 RepID=UPI00130485C2|nr:hypothetical protein [Staphylococcus kloosii]
MRTYSILLTLLTIFTLLLALATKDIFVPLALYLVGAVAAIPLKDKIIIGVK